MKIATAIAIIAGFVVATSVRGDTAAVSEDALREVARSAVAAGGNNPSKVIDAFDKQAKARWGNFETSPIALVLTPELTAAILTPLGTFRAQLRERVRKMEPIDSIMFSPTVLVGISPSRINAPDIEKVIVQRDGVTVEPVHSDLSPQEFKTQMGVVVTLHSGGVNYPIEAFAPGARVTVTLVPASGSNITTTLSDKELSRIR